MKTNGKPAKTTPTATAPPPPTPAASETAGTSLSALSWFTQAALVIPFLTIVGAWYVLYFEAGYLDYFYIHHYFISLSPSIVLGTSSYWLYLLAFLLSCTIALVVLISISDWLYERQKKKRKEGDETKEPLWLKQALVCIIGLFFLLFLVLGGFYFFVKGRNQAENQEPFHVFTTSFDSFKSEVAVIRVYGEHLYAVPFNRDTKEFERQLVIVKMSDIKAPISFKRIGPLKAKP
jgi:hypothetical protein